MREIKMDTILYGKQGVGKTTRAKAIAKQFGHKKIIDGASQEDIKTFYGKNVLFITNEKPSFAKESRRKYRVVEMKANGSLT